MARLALINTTPPRRAGDVLDDAQGDPIDEVRKAGGILATLTPGIQQAVAQAAALRSRGGAEPAVGALMAAAWGLHSGSAMESLAQEQWVVDPLLGDDSNVGDAAAPLKTLQEWARRIGSGVATVAMTVQILAAEIDEPGGWQVRGSFPFGLTIQGQRNVIQSGTVTAVQGWANPVGAIPGVDGQITDSALSGTSWSDSGPGGASLVGKWLALTSGPSAGAAGPILLDLGAKVARHGPLYDALAFALATPAVGTTYDVYEPTVLRGGVFEQVAISTGADLVTIQDVKFVAGGGSFRSIAIYGTSLLLHCEVAGIQAAFLGNVASAHSMFGCLNATVPSGSFGGLVQNGQLGFWSNTSHLGPATAFAKGGGVDMNGLNVRQGGVGVTDLQVQSGSNVRVLSGAAWAAFDDASASAGAMVVEHGGQLQVEGQVWGLDLDNGHGIWVDSGGTVVWPRPGSAVAHFNFDAGGTSTGIDDFEIGDVAKTVAVLGTAGFVEPLTAAKAVPAGIAP